MNGDEFRTAREAAGLSREAVAVELGVVGTTVWRWESGRTPIPKLAADRIAQLAKRKRPAR